jgi:hypothetical protein
VRSPRSFVVWPNPPYPRKTHLTPQNTSENDSNVNTRPDSRVPVCPYSSPEKTSAVEGWCPAPVPVIGHAAAGGEWIAERGCEGWKERREVGICEEGGGDWERDYRDNGKVGKTVAAYVVPGLAFGESRWIVWETYHEAHVEGSTAPIVHLMDVLVYGKRWLTHYFKI